MSFVWFLLPRQDGVVNVGFVTRSCLLFVSYLVVLGHSRSPGLSGVLDWCNHSLGQGIHTGVRVGTAWLGCFSGLDWDWPASCLLWFRISFCIGQRGRHYNQGFLMPQ